MRTLLILLGIPGSGKSTYARDLIKQEPNRWKRVNRDDLRGMVDDHTWSKENEKFIVDVQNNIIRSAFEAGYDVILDNTNLVRKTVDKAHRLAEEFGDVKVIEVPFNTSLAECIERNAKRVGHARVPEKVIHDMARASGISKGFQLQGREVYYPLRSSAKQLAQDEKLPKAIICDLDGTLAIIGDRSPYDASNCDIVDKPNLPVIECVRAMWARGYEIIFMSGRDSKYREPTVRFIEKHLTTTFVKYSLHMRKEGDTRKDSIVKRELFDEHVAGKYNVQFVLDDRNQVCQLWRSLGLTCFQVAEGDF